MNYEDWAASTFGTRIPAPGTRVATSWSEETVWGHRAHVALCQIEVDYAEQLLWELKQAGTDGAIAEFGIFEGWWIGRLWEITEGIGMQVPVYGFDSFEGLSEPHSEHDLAFWQKGQYACSLEQVVKNVRADERPRIRLIKGFFSDSLKTAAAQEIERFCYVRIDCDIYEPALECLRYLGPRLADGAILVFDDWPHMLGVGEQRAFQEWVSEVPNLRFEFLFYNTIGHFYIRVHHRGLEKQMTAPSSSGKTVGSPYRALAESVLLERTGPTSLNPRERVRDILATAGNHVLTSQLWRYTRLLRRGAPEPKITSDLSAEQLAIMVLILYRSKSWEVGAPLRLIHRAINACGRFLRGRS